MSVKFTIFFVAGVIKLDLRLFRTRPISIINLKYNYSPFHVTPRKVYVESLNKEFYKTLRMARAKTI